MEDVAIGRRGEICWITVIARAMPPCNQHTLRPGNLETF
jgi:hypothetical protein